MTAVATGHIWLDEQGVAWIDDTNTKVIEVVLEKLAYGSDPEEIHEQHPHLSLSQIHAAFAYYYEHQEDLDADMHRRYQEAEALRAQAGPPPWERKLAAAEQK